MTDRERLLDELGPPAFAIAYRMLGSVSEAEDVVQETLLRIHQALDAGERIASPRAFVATVTTRLAINELRSARARRERYCCSTMCSTTGIRRSLRSSARARTTCASSRPAPDVVSRSAGLDSKRRASSATQPRRARRDQLTPERPRSGGVAAPRAGQRRTGSALSRRTASAGCRGGARHRRRSDHTHQLNRQPRQTDAPPVRHWRLIDRCTTAAPGRPAAPGPAADLRRRDPERSVRVTAGRGYFLLALLALPTL